MLHVAQFSVFLYTLAAIISFVLIALLAKRKTTTPMTTAFFGFIISFAPPLSYIFVAVLLVKNDVPQNGTSGGYYNRL